MSSGPDFGKMIGPLPLGAWVAVVGGGLAFMLYTRNQSASAATDTTGTDTTAVDDTSGVAGVGDGTVGGWVATTPTTTDTTQTYATNEQWGTAATTWLIAQGYSPAVADSAIRKYLDQEKGYSAQEYALVTLAIAHQPPPSILPAPLFGPPKTTKGGGGGTKKKFPKEPKPKHKPGPSPKPGHGKPSPHPKPKPQPRIYVVRPGDSLSKIAGRVYHNPKEWQKIYNANRGKIKNPNIIRPGQRLTIP